MEQQQKQQHNIGIETTASKGERRKTKVVYTYAVQCEQCLAWRVIATQEEYEDIRVKMSLGEEFHCAQKAGSSCQVLADIDGPDHEDDDDDDDDDDNRGRGHQVEYDGSRTTWTLERKIGPSRIPKGFGRCLVLRGDASKVDAYYTVHTDGGRQQRFKTLNQVMAFLATRKEDDRYKDLKPEHFSFDVPKVVDHDFFQRYSNFTRPDIHNHQTAPPPRYHGKKVVTKRPKFSASPAPASASPAPASAFASASASTSPSPALDSPSPALDSAPAPAPASAWPSYRPQSRNSLMNPTWLDLENMSLFDYDVTQYFDN